MTNNKKMALALLICSLIANTAYAFDFGYLFKKIFDPDCPGDGCPASPASSKITEPSVIKLPRGNYCVRKREIHCKMDNRFTEKSPCICSFQDGTSISGIIIRF